MTTTGVDGMPLVLACAPFAVVRIAATETRSRLVDPSMHRPRAGQAVVIELVGQVEHSAPLAALAREVSRRAPFVTVAGGTPSVRESLAHALMSDRPGLIYSWPDTQLETS